MGRSQKQLYVRSKIDNLKSDPYSAVLNSLKAYILLECVSREYQADSENLRKYKLQSILVKPDPYNAFSKR